MAFEVIWQYRVKLSHREEFLRAYRSAGDWSELFSRHPGYLESRLLFDAVQKFYITVDSWKSEGDYREFFVLNQADYDAMDRRFAHFVESTSPLGTFTTL